MSWFEDLSHVPAPIKEEDAHEVLMSYLLLFRHGLPLDLEECNGVQLVLFIFLSVKLMKLFFWKVKSLREWSADQSLFLALNRWSKWFKFKYCISFVWIPVAPNCMNPGESREACSNERTCSSCWRMERDEAIWRRGFGSWGWIDSLDKGAGDCAEDG